MSLIIYLQQTPYAFVTLMGIIGLLVGSFLNVVILRLPKMMHAEWNRECKLLLEISSEKDVLEEEYNLVRPRSHCPNCEHKIAAWENIPVLSYLLLKGKCSNCQNPISIRYPTIELLSGLLTLFIAGHFGFGLQAIFAVLLTWALLSLSIIDAEHQLLPDDITLPFLWLGILINTFGLFTDVYSSLFGVMAGYGSLWSVYMLFKLVTGKEGMGYGDFKLLAMLGAWMGWQILPLVIILSSMCGAIVGVGLILARKHDRKNPIPFGPYLAMAGWIALIWGTEITNVYSTWAFH